MCGFFVQLYLKLLCNEDTLWASLLEMIIGNCVCVSALPLDLKINSEGNAGDQNQLHLVSLSSYVWNWYVMKMLAFAGNDLKGILCE